MHCVKTLHCICKTSIYHISMNIISFFRLDCRYFPANQRRYHNNLMFIIPFHFSER